MEMWNCLQVVAYLRLFDDETIDRYATSPEKPWSFAGAPQAFNADMLYRAPASGQDDEKRAYHSLEAARAARQPIAEAAQKEERESRMSLAEATDRLRGALIGGRLAWTGKNAPATALDWMAEKILARLDVWFDADAVRALWPRLPPTVDEFLSRTIEGARENGGKIDRGDREPGFVTDCMEQTGCTREEARAAWKRVPEDLRRRPGQRRKSAQRNVPGNVPNPG